MFNLFDIAKTEKQICQLHVLNLECILLHNQIKSDVFNFKTTVRMIQYPQLDFQTKIQQAHREVTLKNNSFNPFW